MKTLLVLAILNTSNIQVDKIKSSDETCRVYKFKNSRVLNALSFSINNKSKLA